MNLFRLALLTCCLATNSIAAEGDQKATITRLSGDVKLFTNPFLIKKGEGPHVRYRNKFYNVRDAVVGDVMGNKDVLQAGPEATALVIFPNGDQITVSPGASYELGWQEGSGKKPVMDVLSGMIRGQIQPGGPRAGMEVMSKTTTMGVRGTDFTVSSWSNQGGSTVTVLRGEVEVKTTEGKKVGNVSAGKTAVVAKSPGAVWQPKVEPTPKEQLIEIQKATAVPPPAKDQPMTADVAQKLEKLESAAVTNTLADIKKHDPKQYETIVAKSGEVKPDLYALQTATVHEVFKEAPAASPEVEETAKLAFVETPPPVAPTLRAPESDSQYGYQTTAPLIAFAWNELPQTSMYDVQIAADRDFRRLVGTQRVRDTGWEKQLEDGTYYWRTRGVDDASRSGGWSETRLVAVKSGAATPALVDPAPGSDVETANFKWTRVDGLTDYKVVVTRDPEGKDVVASETTTGDTVALSMTEEGLYYWTVEGTSGDRLLAARSDAGSFTLGGGSISRSDESTPAGPKSFEISVATVIGNYNREVSGPTDDKDDGGSSNVELRVAYDVNERVQLAGQHRQIGLSDVEAGGGNEPENVDESETVVRAAYAWPVGSFRPGVRLGYMMSKFRHQGFNGLASFVDKTNTSAAMAGAGVTHLLSGSSRWFLNGDVNVTGSASGIDLLQMRTLRLEAGFAHEPFSWPLRLTYGLDLAQTTLSYETEGAPFEAETSEQRTGLLVRAGFLL